ncbi:MAG: phosphatase PAP2 family protein, partial [Bacteroidales bacterium]|nr:phosphatase PAP2 family protein [Bacteroidales bacterium]
AMPSFHLAYPVLVLYYSIKKGVSLSIKILLSIFMTGIWFSAVYSGHHYIIDVLAGVILAILGLSIFEKMTKNPEIQYKIANFSQII